MIARVVATDVRLAKPPLAELVFDITLTSEVDSMYALVPTWIGEVPASNATCLVQMLEWKAATEVVYSLRIDGDGGYHAFLLAPHATLQLRRFAIEWIHGDDLPDFIDFNLASASAVAVGGAAITSLFPEAVPMTGSHAVIKSRLLRAKTWEHAVPIEYVGIQGQSIRVVLPPPRG